MNFFNVIKAAFRSFFGLKSVFKVTKKGIGESVGITDIAPQLIIGLLAFAGVTWGGLKLYYDIHSSFKGMTAAIFMEYGERSSGIVGNQKGNQAILQTERIPVYWRAACAIFS